MLRFEIFEVYVADTLKIVGGELDWGRGSERKKVIKSNSWVSVLCS